jgi:hypothetical protein
VDSRGETVEATYIAGCDGARPLVRETIGAGFPGGASRQLFCAADVVASGGPIDCELHVDFDKADVHLLRPDADVGLADETGSADMLRSYIGSD